VGRSEKPEEPAEAQYPLRDCRSRIRRPYGLTQREESIAEEERWITLDMPEVLDWSKAEIGKFYRPPKKAVTMRLDADVLKWLKGYGKGYQTRVNLLLRHAMASTTDAPASGKTSGARRRSQAV
jgi:uncharacterized protein (DUF4415 family)